MVTMIFQFLVCSGTLRAPSKKGRTAIILDNVPLRIILLVLLQLLLFITQMDV
jgi:hypothetical protein